MGTLGKALGASGGYICGSRALIDYLINRARSFIFSTAPPPAAAATATAGVNLVREAEGKCLATQLWQRVKEFQSVFGRLSSRTQSAISPIILGDENAAIAAATQLRERGIFVPAIRYPSVARGSARLRITLTAAHSAEDIAVLITALHASRITQHKPKLPIGDCR
jgi:glycine C-acetyltransferase/8-amino-7-oxononanoate synthase